MLWILTENPCWESYWCWRGILQSLAAVSKQSPEALDGRLQDIDLQDKQGYFLFHFIIIFFRSRSFEIEQRQLNGVARWIWPRIQHPPEYLRRYAVAAERRMIYCYYSFIICFFFGFLLSFCGFFLEELVVS